MKPHILYDLKWEIKIKRGTKRISPHYINPPGLTQINNLYCGHPLQCQKRKNQYFFFGEKKH